MSGKQSKQTIESDEEEIFRRVNICQPSSVVQPTRSVKTQLMQTKERGLKESELYEKLEKQPAEPYQPQSTQIKERELKEFRLDEQKPKNEEFPVDLKMKKMPDHLVSSTNFFIRIASHLSTIKQLYATFNKLKVTFMLLSNSAAKWRCSKSKTGDNCEFFVTFYECEEKDQVNCEFQFRKGSRALFWNIFKPAKEIMLKGFEEFEHSEEETEKKESERPYPIDSAKMEERIKRFADRSKRMLEADNLEVKMEAMKALAVESLKQASLEIIAKDNSLVNAALSTIEKSLSSPINCDFSFSIRHAGMVFLNELAKFDAGALKNRFVDANLDSLSMIRRYYFEGLAAVSKVLNKDKGRNSFVRLMTLRSVAWALEREKENIELCALLIEKLIGAPLLETDDPLSLKNEETDLSSSYKALEMKCKSELQKFDSF